MITEQFQMKFQKIYKLLQVRAESELRFSKGQREDLKKKFMKLSKVGIQNQLSENEVKK